MKLRYYLRGLGIGVTVTAIIMSITAKPEELTDAQIKIRAAQLGMVEQNVLADLDKSEEVVLNDKDTEKESIEGTTEEKVSEEIQEETTMEKNDSNGNKNKQENSEKNPIGEDKKQQEGSSKNETDVTSSKVENAEDKKQTTIISSQNNKVENYILITVESGCDSHTVSKKLYEAGLVNSTNDYDNYLMENGYERKIRAGNHEIPVGASKEEIAKILCRMK